MQLREYGGKKSGSEIGFTENEPCVRISLEIEQLCIHTYFGGFETFENFENVYLEIGIGLEFDLLSNPHSPQRPQPSAPQSNIGKRNKRVLIESKWGKEYHVSERKFQIQLVPNSMSSFEELFGTNDQKPQTHLATFYCIILSLPSHYSFVRGEKRKFRVKV